MVIFCFFLCEIIIFLCSICIENWKVFGNFIGFIFMVVKNLNYEYVKGYIEKFCFFVDMLCLIEI